MTAVFRRVVAGSACAALLTVTAALPALAQAPTSAPAPPVTAWVGTWSGPFVSDGPTGTLTLVIAREGETWKVEHTVTSDGAPPGGDVRDWKVEGNVVTFAQTVGDLETQFHGTLEGEEMKGTIEAYQAGTFVGAATFTLRKQ